MPIVGHSRAINAHRQDFAKRTLINSKSEFAKERV